MTERFDLVIAGGGPSGSAAAWQAVQTGAKVVVLDKAEFPRDKPCGDGLTARAVSYLQKMGLAHEVAQLPTACIHPLPAVLAARCALPGLRALALGEGDAQPTLLCDAQALAAAFECS